MYESDLERENRMSSDPELIRIADITTTRIFVATCICVPLTPERGVTWVFPLRQKATKTPFVQQHMSATLPSY